jgi:hypothetical protein
VSGSSEPLAAVPDPPEPPALPSDSERLEAVERRLSEVLGLVSSLTGTVGRLKEVVSQLMAEKAVRAMGPQLEEAIKAKVASAIDGEMPSAPPASP